jgi:hypothetical protein
MNPKTRLFLGLTKGLILAANDHSLFADANDLPSLFLEIALLYRTKAGSDQSQYWFCFVYDLVASLGIYPDSNIGLLSSDLKKQAMEIHFRSMQELRGGTQPCYSDISLMLSKLLGGINIELAGKLENVILSYAYVLISIDRNIDSDEQLFYNTLLKEIRQGTENCPEKPNDNIIHNPGEANRSERFVNSVVDDDINSALREIKGLIGLSNIKEEVSSLVNTLRIQQLRAQSGFPALEISNHMVFQGNPGTGKTTIARLLGRIYKALGILSKGHFIETDRSALVAGYLGQTALKTTEVLNKALGGILFIDEAYSLSQGNGFQDPYGSESVDTILKYMEDNRGDIVVIVAGYQDLMSEFLETNPGLKSRFNKYFDFHDYTPAELAQIYLQFAASSGYSLDTQAIERLGELCTEAIERKTKSFGNGRTIRNLFEKTVVNHANRLAMISNPNRNDLQVIYVSDLRRDDLLSVIK